MRAADSQTLAASASASFQLQSTPACCAVSNASHRSNSWSSPSSSAARPLTSATVIRTGENRVISWNMELQQLVQRFSGCGVKALSLQGDGNFTISPAADSARVKIGGSAPSIGTKCFTGVPCGATPHRCGSPRVIGSSRACANASIRYAPEAACPTRAAGIRSRQSTSREECRGVDRAESRGSARSVERGQPRHQTLELQLLEQKAQALDGRRRHGQALGPRTEGNVAAQRR
jgi:hypothetical protein